MLQIKWRARGKKTKPNWNKTTKPAYADMTLVLLFNKNSISYWWLMQDNLLGEISFTQLKLLWIKAELHFYAKTPIWEDLEGKKKKGVHCSCHEQWYGTAPAPVLTHEGCHSSLVSTWTWRHWSQLPIHQLVHPSNPCRSILETRTLCGMVSNALHKST